MYAYNKLNDETGFDTEFHKNTLIKRFTNRKKDNNTIAKADTIRLTLSQIVEIENVINSLEDNSDNLKLSFIWYMLFEEGCTVTEIREFESKNFDGKILKSSTGKKYTILDKHKKLMDKLNSLEYNGISIYRQVKKLGEYAGIEALKPEDIKIARKQSMLTCSNCRREYTNSESNWRTIDKRVICTDCADEILKKNGKYRIGRILGVNNSIKERTLFFFRKWNEEEDRGVKQRQEANDLIGRENELVVKGVLESEGYTVIKVSNNEGFDFHVYNDVDEYVIEVKTLNNSRQFYITANEIDHMFSARLANRYKIFLVQGNQIFIVNTGKDFLLSKINQENCLLGREYGGFKISYDSIKLSIDESILNSLPIKVISDSDRKRYISNKTFSNTDIAS